MAKMPPSVAASDSLDVVPTAAYSSSPIPHHRLHVGLFVLKSAPAVGSRAPHDPVPVASNLYIRPHMSIIGNVVPMQQDSPAVELPQGQCQAPDLLFFITERRRFCSHALLITSRGYYRHLIRWSGAPHNLLVIRTLSADQGQAEG
ncbi:hypothetical protein V8E53_014218 [Lactarius tabidus]